MVPEIDPGTYDVDAESEAIREYFRQLDPDSKEKSTAGDDEGDGPMNVGANAVSAEELREALEKGDAENLEADEEPDGELVEYSEATSDASGGLPVGL